MKKILTVLTVGALMGVFFKDAFAAPSVPPVPSGQDLTAQAERFRQEYSIEKRSREKQITKALVEAEEKENAAIAPGVSFVLKGIHVTGITIFDPKKLDFIWKLYVGKKVNFIDLNNIVKLVNRVYADLGYLTMKAYLPPQDITNGEVEIRIVEGKRGDLKVQGNYWFSNPSIAKYFHTYRGEVMDMGDIEKDMTRLNENKDLNVVSVLSPGQEPETVDVTLKAREIFPYHVSIGTDNEGSRLSGRYRRLVGLSASNLTGNEDNFSFNGAFTDLSSGYYASYQAPVGTHGTKLGLDVGYFQGKLGDEYKPFDIVNYTAFYDPNASFELYLSENAQVNLRSGIKIEHVNKKESGVTITDEYLRLPYLALDAVRTDSMGQTTFSPELSFSAPGFLGGSRHGNALSSRPGVDGFFAKYDQYLNRTQRMPWGSYAQIRTQVQFASHALPTSEQLQLGGANSVRGYPEGDYLADTGWDLQTEWYFPSYFIPAKWQLRGSDLRHGIEPFIFYDMGGGNMREVGSGELKSQFLVGVGAGLMIRIGNNMYLKVEWGVPRGDKPVRGTGPSTFDVSFQAST